MSFFSPANLRAIAGGTWLRRPASEEELIGFGIDTRQDLSSRAYIAIKGAMHDGHDFLAQAAAAGARLLIIERDVPAAKLPPGLGALRVESTRKCLLRMASNYRDHLTGARIIAITGSCGKTTTRRLIHHVLSSAMRGSEAPKSFNNEIGVPLTLLAAQPAERYVLLELGTNAPGEIGQLAAVVRPDIAVITMVGQAHLEKLGTIEGVAREKASLLFHLRESGLAVVNADCPALREYLRPLKSVIRFGRSEDADLRLTGRGDAARSGTGRRSDGRWWFEINGLTRFELGLAGEHNAMNAIAAIAVARRMGLSDDQINAALATVQPPPMRMTQARIGAIDLYNDAYNANPDSMRASLAAFAELAQSATRRVVVLGDMLELGPESERLHREVGAAVLALLEGARIDHAVFVGRFARTAAGPLLATSAGARVNVVDELNSETGPAVADLLEPGDAVLLKGSRGAAVERLIEYIERRWEQSTIADCRLTIQPSPVAHRQS